MPKTKKENVVIDWNNKPRNTENGQWIKDIRPKKK